MSNILVIDDETGLRNVLGDILTAEGHRVVLASGGDEGFKLFANESFDLIVTDIVMGNGEGLETITKIRKDDKVIPIIAISGGGRVPGNVYLGLASRLGADWTFCKPFDVPEFVDAVNRFSRSSGGITK